MVDRVEVTSPETTTDKPVEEIKPTQSKPEGLPEKFNSVDELVKSYSELEKKPKEFNKIIKELKIRVEIGGGIRSLKNIDTYDIIVSNPPYLSDLEYKKTTKEIQSYEPKIALIGGIDGLKFYRNIANFLTEILSSTSIVFIEIGNNQAKEVMKIFKSKKIKCLELAKDIQQLNRLLILQKNQYKINVD